MFDPRLAGSARHGASADKGDRHLYAVHLPAGTRAVCLQVRSRCLQQTRILKRGNQLTKYSRQRARMAGATCNNTALAQASPSSCCHETHAEQSQALQHPGIAIILNDLTSFDLPCELSFVRCRFERVQHEQVGLYFPNRGVRPVQLPLLHSLSLSRSPPPSLFFRLLSSCLSRTSCNTTGSPIGHIFS